jgi:hypothetical protein
MTDDVRSFHGTRADLVVGALIEPGFRSNSGQRKAAKWVSFGRAAPESCCASPPGGEATATMDAAIWGAELAVGDGPGRISVVEPTGAFMDDPNLTDKKFPGNPTKSYRTAFALRVVDEVRAWEGHAPELLAHMKAHLERLKQQGIEAIEE